VIDYVKKYASEEALRNKEDEAVSSSSESSMSDFSEDEAQVITVPMVTKIISHFSKKPKTSSKHTIVDTK
jgi:hypothetical protein